MKRPIFDRREFEVIGTYPAQTTDFFASFGMPSVPPEPKLNKPISPKENWKLIFNGEKPYWIPKGGWLFCDINAFRPRMHPDNLATRIIFDGEAAHPYAGDLVRSSWFDIDWQWVETAGGATVLPGKPKVKDITSWEEYISFPNLHDLDWEGCAEKNKDYLFTDKLNQLGIICGFWERLMALMDVDNAAIAMIDDEQKIGIHRFFNQLTDLFIGFITRMKKHCDIDGVIFHDDWSHQNGPFFSIATINEMLVPYLKRVVDATHTLGLSFELHSCGKAERIVPAFIEAGVDLWCGQAMNDFEMLAHKYKDAPIIFGMPTPAIQEGATEDDLRQIAKNWVDRYKDCKVVTSFMAAPPSLTDAIYEFSRIAYQDEE